ncbi:MAG: Hpt domain-containing protein [Oscillospiraceae bacterium]|nr:Hpt domain-containing protein [Oscillospiraceae bacterium]
MTLRDCYAAFGGNYDDVLGRLRSERMIQKFVLKFLDDASYETLCVAMAAQNREEAFRAAHTIKGVCQNLGFTALLASSSALSDALRHEWMPEAPALAKQVGDDYRCVTEAICAFQSALEA